METYVHGGFGDTLTFEFPVANLASWQARVAELEALAPRNPFAVIVLAHSLPRLPTGRNPLGRQAGPGPRPG